MDQHTSLIMFALLRSAIRDDLISDGEREVFSENMLPTLYETSDRQDLAHVLGHALKKNKLLSEDSEWAQKFHKKQFKAGFLYEQTKFEFENICSILESANIPFIPLKGAVIRDYYSQPWMRTSCDIDVLIHKEDLAAAKEALVEKGEYKVHGKENYHDVSLYSPGGVHLELHFTINENIEKLDTLLSRVWEYSYRLPPEGFEYRQTAEYLIFHVYAHMSYHFVNGGCGIRPFIDVFLLRSKMEYDENKVLEMCAACGIEKFYRSINELVDIWFNGRPYTELARRIESYIIDGGVYGTKGNVRALETRRNGGKIKYILRRIFVPNRILYAKYPNLKKHKWLMPLYQVRRWFGAIYKGRIKSSVTEVKLIAGVDPERANEVASLMKEIEL